MSINDDDSKHDNIHDEDKILNAFGPFLEKRLTDLGLDYETYGSYIVPLLVSSVTTTTTLSTTTTTTVDTIDEDENQEEWDSVLELLQASSETHCDDDNVWVQLKHDIQIECQKYRKVLMIEQHDRQERKLKELANQLQKEKDIAIEAAMKKLELEKQQQEATTDHNSKDSMDLTKKMLIERFGYEKEDGDDSNDDNDGMYENNTKSTTTDDSTTIISNREYAMKLEKERIQQLRTNSNVTSKKDEQKKTSDSKKQKEITKEERRKRAVKGERKR